jgi:hypothetical protein
MNEKICKCGHHKAKHDDGAGEMCIAQGYGWKCTCKKFEATQMTVEDVIESLSKFPKNAVVIINGGDWAGAVTRIEQDEFDKKHNQVQLHCDE